LQQVAELERVRQDYEKLINTLTVERSILLQWVENHDLLASLDDQTSCTGHFDLDALTNSINADVTSALADHTLESHAL
jgi:hypothetical protein